MAGRRLITVIQNEISPDDFDDSERLELFYKNLNDNEKRAVDQSFSFLCGLPLRTLIVAKEL